MKFIGMIVIGILGFIIGEGISKAIRKDTTTKNDDSTLTWVLKIGCAAVLMAIVYESCSK